MSGGTTVETRVRQVSDILYAHAGGIELDHIDDDGTVHVQFTGACTGCPYRPVTMAATIRPSLLQIEGVTGVEATGSRISEEAETPPCRRPQQLVGVRPLPARPSCVRLISMAGESATGTQAAVGPIAPLQASFFNYFGDYRWSSGLLMALGSAAYGGADIGEVHQVGRTLSSSLGDDHAWFATWTQMGERVAAQAHDHEAAGRSLTAASAYLRAASYLQIGERFVTDKTDESNAVFATAVSYFGRFAELTERPAIERVEVPYEDGATLPAYFVHPVSTTEGPSPCVVFFDGLDITKELQYLRGVEELSRRGIGCLVVDGPGNGETIRFRGLPLRYDYDVAGTAALEYLLTP